MNGPEHYREAEKCMTSAAESSISNGEAAYYLALGQVHATLAQAAALIDRSSMSGARLSVEWEMAVQS